MRCHSIAIIGLFLSMRLHVRLEFFGVLINYRQKINFFEMKFNSIWLILARCWLKKLSFSWLLLLRIYFLSRWCNHYWFIFIFALVNYRLVLFFSFLFPFDQCRLMRLVCRSGLSIHYSWLRFLIKILKNINTILNLILFTMFWLFKLKLFMLRFIIYF